jgi:hypothetical protein
MWRCILVCGEELIFLCNEAEDLSPFGLHINILDGAHNFKGGVVTFYCKKRNKMLFVFNLHAIMYSIWRRCFHHLPVMVLLGVTFELACT